MRYEFNDKEQISQEEVRQALNFASGQVIRNLFQFTYEFQNAYSVDNFYEPIENNGWTMGFWTGEIWLAYEYTKDERLRYAAEIQMNDFLRRINKSIGIEHHELGILYTPSCVAGYKLTGSERAREAAIKAAEKLICRYQPVGEFIQAWGSMNQPNNYRLMVSSLLNMPLLYWAADETKNRRFSEIADKHVRTALDNIIQPDFSIWESFYFSPKSGQPEFGTTILGYQEGSPWTRGQALGIFGIVIGYKYTRRKEYIAYFRGVTNYYLRHLPKDLIPFWDLKLCEESGEPKDSSSASITVCAILEMAKYLEPEESKYYIGIAKKTLKSLWEYYAVKDYRTSNGLVLHSTYLKQSLYNNNKNIGVNECNLWGDYFYLEALTRLFISWDSYW